MIKKNENRTAINAASSMILQLFSIISGFVIPRLILSGFGSEVNGLVSSFNQFFGYISIFEGGLTGVVMAKLYRPIIDNDVEKISSIMVTTKKFYNRLSLIFVTYTVAVSLIYPFFIQTDLSYEYISSLGIVLGLSLFIQYNYALALRILINSDEGVWLVSLVQIIIIIINICLFAIVIHFFPSIHFLKFITGITYILQPIMYNKYVNSRFRLNRNAKVDNELIKDRWNGFAISLAAFIHHNTDVILLTFLTNLKTVSVYSVYALVTKGLQQLIRAFSSGIVPAIGNVYASGDKERLDKLFNFYEYIIFLLSFFFFSVGGLLLTPFVQIYTKGIKDINYYEPTFGIILVLAECIFCLREPYLNMAFSANKFKETTPSAYVEAGLNIAISIVLVIRLGLIGAAIGTLIAMIYRTIYQVRFLRNNILYRSPMIFVRRLSPFIFSTIIGVIICVFVFPISKCEIVDWIIHAIIYSVIMGTLDIIITIMFFKQEFIIILKKSRIKG